MKGTTFETVQTGSTRTAVGLFVVLVLTAMLPVLWVGYFFATDVPSHLHSAYVLNNILSGNGGLGVYALNGTAVPNSLGHWMMSLFLVAASPEATSKAMAVLTWAGFAAAVPFLRFCVKGAEGVVPAVLFGAVLSYNFLWILGLYNFILGAALSLFSVGLLYRWKGKITIVRMLSLGLLAVAVYFGHMVAFGVLVLAAGAHFVTNSREYGRTGLVKLGAAFLPAGALLLSYEVMKADGGFAPRWYIAELGLTARGVLEYLKQTDPFPVIGDHNVAPFFSGESPLFLLASPSLWLIAGIAVLAIATIRKWRAESGSTSWGLLILMLVLLTAALVSPEDLGSTQGSILRQRLVLMSIALFAPMFVMPSGRIWRNAVLAALGLAFVLQTAALWEYSLKYDAQAREILAVERVIEPGDRIASVLVMRDDSKFQESGVKRISSLIGIHKNSVVWDNYETGYYFFPVVAERESDRKFVRDLSNKNTFRIRRAGGSPDPDQLADLEKTLESGGDRIDTLILWGRDPEIEKVVLDRFGPGPSFEEGDLRVFKRTR